MGKKKKFWNITRIIVTTLLLLVFLFILFKLGIFDTLLEKFLTTSVPSDTPSVGAIVNGGGGIK